MIDIAREIDAVQRAVGSGSIAAGEGRMVRLERTFDAPIDDVWDAVTDPERIGRWFLPISGDLRVGGQYQLEGQAGGRILACEPPHRFRVTWVFGEVTSPEQISEVEVRLAATGDESTSAILEHTAIVPDEMWGQYGPGAVGVGWDQVLLGVALYLRSGLPGDKAAWPLTPEGREFVTLSSGAWGVANVAAGEDPAVAASAVANTTGFYAPDPAATS